MTIQIDINSPEPVNLSIHGSIITPWAEGFIFKDMKGSKISVEVNGVFYESLKLAGRQLKYDKETVKRRCLSEDFPNYNIIPYQITYIEKKCTVCGEMKLLKEFSVDKRHKDNLSSECKECYKVYKAEYLKNNSEHVKEYKKEYHKNNHEYIKEYRSQPDVKNKRNKKAREKRETDIDFKVNSVMRNAIRKSLKGGKNGAHWESLVDYTCEELRAHLESLFTDGMTWENYGKGKYKWNIDHVIARSIFNITSAECQEFRDCWALDNLQPLWETRNQEKGNKPMHLKYLIKPDWIK